MKTFFNIRIKNSLIFIQIMALIIMSFLYVNPVHVYADPEAPYLTGSDPYNGQTNVSIDAAMNCSFSTDVSDPANAGFFYLTKSGGESISISVYPAGNTVTVQPVSSLDYSSIYILYINPGIAGPDGTANDASYSITFVTEADPNASEPTPTPSTGGNGDGTGGGAGRSIPVAVSSFSPYDGETNVSCNVTISCQFTHNVADASISGANVGHISLSKADGTPVALNVYVADTQIEFDKRQFIYADPVSALEPGTDYVLTVTAGVTAKNGNSSTETQSITFRTEGTAPTASATVTPTSAVKATATPTSAVKTSATPTSTVKTSATPTSAVKASVTPTTSAKSSATPSSTANASATPTTSAKASYDASDTSKGTSSSAGAESITGASESTSTTENSVSSNTNEPADNSISANAQNGTNDNGTGNGYVTAVIIVIVILAAAAVYYIIKKKTKNNPKDK